MPPTTHLQQQAAPSSDAQDALAAPRLEDEVLVQQRQELARTGRPHGCDHDLANGDAVNAGRR